MLQVQGAGILNADAPYDEYWQGGQPRPHQRMLHERLVSLPGDQLARLRRGLGERLAEQEVTFNILGVPDGTNRPWELDCIPFVVDTQEFERLSVGLRQRARVMEAALQDLYGPQRLIREGVLPARAVLANPRFWRPLHGWTPVGEQRLIVCGMDVAKDPKGNYHVFSDRAAAPTGSGYALENRLVLGRALPDLFRDYSVQKINRYFQAFRRVLQQAVPDAEREPRIVLLTPGPQDESSFEHAYLARYLGFELVEGRDLTVRDEIVYMKTLSGLRRVHVILRRIRDEWCDPLELREDSALGIAGLVGAARAGTVSIANPLGSGLVDSPLFKAYWEKISQFFFGESLLVPSVPTWWCAEPDALRYVLSHLDELTLKPAFEDRLGEPVLPAKLSAADRQKLVEELIAHPQKYVAERWPELSVAPLLKGQSLVQGTATMRTFVCSNEDDFDVMPGGLARTNAYPDGIFLSSEGDRGSKDVWVPAAQAVVEQPLPSMPDMTLEFRRGGVDLPSRLLDDIYWLGRYVERADSVARLVRAGLERALSEDGALQQSVLQGIVATLTSVEAGPAPARPAGKKSAVGYDDRLYAALLRGDVGNSIRNVLNRIHMLTERVRSRLSRDAWRVLRTASGAANKLATFQGYPDGNVVMDWLDELIVYLAAIKGSQNDNMVRGFTWRFMDMGARVERGVFVATLIRDMLSLSTKREQMEALLEVSDSLLTYRARYLSRLQLAPVTDLLIVDDSNPRSVLYQANALSEHTAALPRHTEAERTAAERRTIELRSILLVSDMRELCAAPDKRLFPLLNEVIERFWQFNDDLTERFFSHAGRVQAVAPSVWINEDLEAP